MSDEPPIVPFRDVLQRRREMALLREPKLPQDYASLEDYHEEVVALRRPPRPSVANVGYDRIKGHTWRR